MWTCDKCGLTANLGPDDFPLTCSCGQMYEVGKARGLGDSLAKLTKAVGVRPCGGCEKRRKVLNNWFPFGSGEK